MPSPSPKDLSRILADINKQIATAEQLTIQPSDYETPERASKVLRELLEQRREVETKLRTAAESQARAEHGQKYWFPAKRYGWGWGLPTDHRIDGGRLSKRRGAEGAVGWKVTRGCIDFPVGGTRRDWKS